MLIAELNISPCQAITLAAVRIRQFDLLEDKLDSLQTIIPLRPDSLKKISKIHVKVATNNSVKILIVAEASILEDLEMASVLFPDKHRLNYPFLSYPHCKVMYLDLDTSVSGVFSTLLERTESTAGNKQLLRQSQKLLTFSTDK